MTSVYLPLMKSVVLPLLLAIPADSGRDSRGISERVDLIELNHFYDDLGRHAYDQVIFYEWSPDYCRFHVIAWCLVEDNLARMPMKLAGSGEYSVRWYDRDAKIQRDVRSQLFRETWSQVDPERANKKLIDEKYRVSLLRATDRQLR